MIVYSNDIRIEVTSLSEDKEGFVILIIGIRSIRIDNEKREYVIEKLEYEDNREYVEEVRYSIDRYAVISNLKLFDTKGILKKVK